MGNYSINTKGFKMRDNRDIEDLVERVAKAARIQTRISDLLVRQSTLIARLNERVIKLETDKKLTSTAAVKVLRNPKSSKAAKALAGLDLTQRNKEVDRDVPG